MTGKTVSHGTCPKKIYHDAEVQGPARYMRHDAMPRFAAQGDLQWGAWTGAPTTR